MDIAAINRAKEHFGKLLEAQMKRMEKVKAAPGWIDYSTLSPLKIGILAGDGIGVYIAAQSKRVLEFLLKDEVKSGRVDIDDIEGLTIENRAVTAAPSRPTSWRRSRSATSSSRGRRRRRSKGDPWPNIESANVAMRTRARPVRQRPAGPRARAGHRLDVLPREHRRPLRPRQQGHQRRQDDLAIDFCVATDPGHGPHHPAGLRACQEERHRKRSPSSPRRTSSRPPTASSSRTLPAGRQGVPRHRVGRLVHRHHDRQAHRSVPPRATSRSSSCPTCTATYLTDEAAQIQGGVGTAGSANIGKQYAMFEAIHGSAPAHGRGGTGPVRRPLAA